MVIAEYMKETKHVVPTEFLDRGIGVCVGTSRCDRGDIGDVVVVQ